MNKTLCLYQLDPYMRSCDSTVVSIIAEPETCLVLDKTIFFPEGGGQPSDTGFITCDFGTLDVTHVYERDGIVYHQIKNNNTAVKTLASITGKHVTCKLNWERRFTHMQRHCGEHILSSAFFELFGGINRGFHMGEDYMTIDINLEEKSEFTQMTDEMVNEAEWVSNQMVWSNLPVTVRRFKTREEAAMQPMRKALAIEDDIVIVCVGDVNKAAGCVACCGTHPISTGEVGLIKIYRWENYKGMIRITFDAGPNALKHYREESALIKILNNRYSSDSKNLLRNIEIREEKNTNARQELYVFKQAYLKYKAEELKNAKNDADRVIIRKYELFKTEDLLSISKTLADISDKLIALVSLKENTLILLSGGVPDCNKIIKDNAPVWNGKGGGRPNSARVMFPSEENLNCFLDYLKQAY